MRNIKFRGITNENNSFVTGYLNENNNSFTINDVPVITETIGQFIGLYDMNDTELYEGDIFSINGKSPKVIKFNEERASFCVANISELKDEDIFDIWQFPSDKWWKDNKYKLKIIGTIYDENYRKYLRK